FCDGRAGRRVLGVSFRARPAPWTAMGVRDVRTRHAVRHDRTCNLGRPPSTRQGWSSSCGVHRDGRGHRLWLAALAVILRTCSGKIGVDSFPAAMTHDTHQRVEHPILIEDGYEELKPRGGQLEKASEIVLLCQRVASVSVEFH